MSFNRFNFTYNNTEEHRLNSFYSAIMRDDVDEISELIALGFDITIKDKYAHNSLYLAISLGSLAVANFLISKGVDINAKDHDGNTLAHAAVYLYNADPKKSDTVKKAIELLASSGAHFDIRNNYNKIPGDYIAKKDIKYLGIDRINELRVEKTMRP